MEHLSSDVEQHREQQVQWRKDKVQELCSKLEPKNRILFWDAKALE